jgi:hypothetical protein
MRYAFENRVKNGDEKEKLCSIFGQLRESPIAELLQSKYGESAVDILLLIGALVLFARNDAESLFDNKKDVDEKAMAGCVYRYMFCACLMKLFESTQPDIDIEYDRMRVVEKGLVSKYLTLCLEPKERCKSRQQKVCNDFIKNHGKVCDKCAQKKKRIRPDLIIHKRKSEHGRGNGMIVEFKRDNVDGCDDVKIAYSTCSLGMLKYKIGAKVTLSSATQKLELYKDSIKVDEIDACKDAVAYNAEGVVA